MAHGGIPFVGRSRERQAAIDVVSSALAGRGAGLLVVGEAGIGKTRLVSEAVQAAPDARRAWAGAWEPGGGPAHWHWVQLLRSVAAGQAHDDVLEDLGADAGELARLVPDLRAGLRLAPAATSEGDDPRFRMYDAVAAFLRRAADRRPMVLVLDDLHAADVGTVALLRFLAVETRADPIALVATARTADSEQLADDLAGALTDVHRHLEAIRLGGLSEADVDALLRHLVTTDDASRLAPTIHRRSGGNPLFVGELGRLVAADPKGLDRPLPTTIRSVIEHRLGGLSSSTHEVLRVAAVFGETFATSLLEQATGRSRAEVLDAIDDALRANVLRPSGAGSFTFDHALTREVLHDTLGLADRARAHRSVGEAIEAASVGDPPLAALAHHFVAAIPAVDDGRAVAYAERAGHAAVAQLAHEDAAAQFETALSVLQTGEEDRRIELLLALGDASMRGGDLDRARRAFVEAADHARSHGRAELLARAAIGLGSGLDGFEVRLFDHAQITLLEEALAAVGPEPSDLRSWLLARLSVALTFAERPESRLQLVDEAIVVARAVDDDRALAYALAARCDATAGPEHIDDRLAAATEAVRLAERTADRGMELLGRRSRLVALLESGLIAAVDAEIDRYALVADAIRQPLYQWYVPLWRGMRALMDGRIADADALRMQSAAIGARAQSRNAALSADVLGWNTRLEEGAWSEAAGGLARQLPLADGIYSERFWVDIVTPQLDPLRATIALDRFLAEDFVSLPRDAIWLATLTYLANSAGVTAHAAAAERLYEIVLPFRSRFAVDGIGAACYGSMARPLGILSRVLGRTDLAYEHFDEALETHRACGAAALVAGTLHDLGEAMVALGDTDRGERTLAEAGDQLRALGMERRARIAAAPIPPIASDSNLFSREGQYWTLTFRGRTTRVSDSKGLRDIATLLAQPGQEVHVADLIGMIHGSGGEEILDRVARAQYRERLIDLRAELDEAEVNNDMGRAEAARVAMDLIASKLAAAVGLGGRARTASDPAERARKAVTQRIRNAIKRLQPVHPDLAAHLDRTIETGRFCSYRPEGPMEWSQ